MSCSVDGCQKIAAARANGMRVCKMHASRWRRHQSFEPTRKWSPPNDNPKPCKVEGCLVIEDGASGYCKKHGTRLRRHGDPTTIIHPTERNIQRGERHHQWTGERASYSAAHQRLAHARGAARDYRCEDCGAQARHWSYTRNSPKELRSAEGPYSPDPMDYVPRCVPCHKAFDLAHIRAAS